MAISSEQLLEELRRVLTIEETGIVSLTLHLHVGGPATLHLTRYVEPNDGTIVTGRYKIVAFGEAED
jgi:hypothetical protein